MKLTKYVTNFHINGGAEPPRYPGGLTFNPFPSIPIYEVEGTVMQLQRMSCMVFTSKEDVLGHLRQIGMDEEF